MLCGGGRDRGREEGLDDIGGQGSVSAFHRRKMSVTKKVVDDGIWSITLMWGVKRKREENRVL